MEEKVNLHIEKHSDLYNLIISQEVERKIRYLCNKISKVEWSGILFYTHSGSYEENNLEIKCVDVFLMDVGNAAYTEFSMSPDVIAYTASHPELLDCQVGLIHSHGSMNTFFSQTDTDTLKEEGAERNHFVSLIVNNEGTYTAAITRKLSIKRISNTAFTYKTFDNIEKEGNESKETADEVISYNYLNVIKEGEPSDFSEIDERLKEINDNKTKVVNPYNLDTDRFSIPPHNVRNWTQPTLFNDKLDEYSYNEKSIDIDKDVVRSITLQLITGSIAISSTSKIDPKKWSNQMVSLYDRVFGCSITKFTNWIELFSDFIINNSIPDKYVNTKNEEFYVSMLCNEVLKSLKKLPSNNYMEIIKDIIESWI